MGAADDNLENRSAPPTTFRGQDPLSIPADAKASIRVLVVEDDQVLRDGLTSMLRLDGYAATPVASGVEALESLRRRPFDIILTDLYLASVSGMDVLRAAQRAKRDTIVVIITGHPSVTTSVEALRAGAWDYLPKPFSATQLQILLGRAAYLVLQGREMRDLREQLLLRQGYGVQNALL